MFDILLCGVNSDLQKPTSVQAMLADMFGGNCGHFEKNASSYCMDCLKMVNGTLQPRIHNKIRCNTNDEET